MQFIQIYCDNIMDMLSPGNENLKIRDGDQGVYIQDITTVVLESVE